MGTLQNAEVERLLGALATYRAARTEFMAALGCSTSNRDPFAEFSECIALAALGGTMAESRTQKGWDFIDPQARRVQVRYLANPPGPWVNGHVVDFRGDGCDRYALVVFVEFAAMSLVVFDREHMSEVCRALGKRHPEQDNTLQLYEANYLAITDDPERFGTLGVEVYDLASGVGP